MNESPTDLTAHAAPAASSDPSAPLSVDPGEADPGSASGDGQAAVAGRGRSTPLDHARILEATAACLAENGYDDTTIREISRRLGCAVGSIYRYFSDKRELLSAVAQQRFEPVAEAAESGCPVADCQRMYLNAARAQPEQYRLMFWLSIVGPSRTATKKQQKQRDRGQHAPDLAPAAVVPPVIQRILRGWSAQLGGPLKAQAAWIHLHGLVMLDQLDVAESMAANHQAKPRCDADGKTSPGPARARVRVRNASQDRVTDPMLNEPSP